jgi:heme/copper-type cytochrome/quinol oxidase subunit 1
MPRASTWAIRLSLIHFTAGILLGATMLFSKAGVGSVGMLNHRLTHVHMMLFGWLVQFVIGVAYWILPKFSEAPRRGNTTLIWGSLLALNLGALLGTGEPWVPSLGGAGWSLEILACLLFSVHLWPRIKGFGG